MPTPIATSPITRLHEIEIHLPIFGGIARRVTPTRNAITNAYTRHAPKKLVKNTAIVFPDSIAPSEASVPPSESQKPIAHGFVSERNIPVRNALRDAVGRTISGLDVGADFNSARIPLIVK